MALGAVLSTTGFLLAFFTAPLVLGAAVQMPALIAGQMVRNKLLFSQKVFYFHVPVALISLIALGVAAYHGFRFLTKHDEADDLKAKVSTEVSLVFILMTMVSGELWERYDWGVWWSWEPRLTTYLILMLLVIAYFVLRSAIDDEGRRAAYSAVFGIIAFVDAPISLIITRIVPNSIHPVVFRTDSGLPMAMLVPFLLSLIGMSMVAFGLYRFRLREQMLRLRLETMLNELDSQE